jgi:hypothetical protein
MQNSDCAAGSVCVPISSPDTNKKYCVPQNKILGCTYWQTTKCDVLVVAGTTTCHKVSSPVKEGVHQGGTCGVSHPNMTCPLVPDALTGCMINQPVTCYAGDW